MPTRPRRILFAAASIAVLLAAATLLIALFERVLGVHNADAVYLVPVVAAAVAFGTPEAIGTAVASFFLYDFFFVSPLTPCGTPRGRGTRSAGPLSACSDPRAADGASGG